MQVTCNGEPATIEVEEFDGHVQLHIQHAFAEAAAAMTLRQSRELMSELGRKGDELAVPAVTELLREIEPELESWTMTYQPYDDMPGAEWIVIKVSTKDRDIDLTGEEIDRWEPVIDRLTEILGDFWEEGSSNEERTIILNPR